MCDFCMATLMILTGHGIEARTHAHAENAHFQTRCISLCLWPRASQALMMHLIGKCVISPQARALAMFYILLVEMQGLYPVSQVFQHNFSNYEDYSD